MFTWAILPIVACTTFGLYASAVSSLHINVEIPNQSAILIIVPRLPGSCTLSRARHNVFSKTEVSITGFGISNSPITCWGCCKKLTLRNSSSDTTASCRRGGTFLVLYHSSVAISCLGSITSIKSFTIFGASATKTPSFMRFFFNSNE